VKGLIVPVVAAISIPLLCEPKSWLAWGIAAIACSAILSVALGRAIWGQEFHAVVRSVLRPGSREIGNTCGK
jgi:hypothetical protein